MIAKFSLDGLAYLADLEGLDLGLEEGWNLGNKEPAELTALVSRCRIIGVFRDKSGEILTLVDAFL